MNEGGRYDYPPVDSQFVSTVGWAVLATLIGVLWFAQAKPGQTQSAVTMPKAVPTAPVMPTTPVASTTPRVLKFTISLTNPDDLKVRQGDYVEANQVFADRTRQQQQLRAQRDKTALSLQRVESQSVLAPPPPLPIPPVKVLPDASYAEQDAAIAEIQSDIELQLRKRDLLATMPPNEVPPALREHEDRILEAQYRELEAAQAALAEAQEDRKYKEYEYSLAMAQRAEQENQQQLAYTEQVQRVEQQRRDREFQIAQLEAQLQNIDAQLAELSTVRSPYSGTIRRVKWLGQSDNRLTVEITLAVGDSPAGDAGEPSIEPVPPVPVPVGSPGPG